eukprot:SAG31_NODE_6151_length_2147_cov_1.144531_2_plen_194_part_00
MVQDDNRGEAYTTIVLELGGATKISGFTDSSEAINYRRPGEALIGGFHKNKTTFVKAKMAGSDVYMLCSPDKTGRQFTYPKIATDKLESFLAGEESDSEKMADSHHKHDCHDLKPWEPAIVEKLCAVLGAGKNLNGISIITAGDLFRAMDADHSGSIDQHELRSGLKELQLLGSGPHQLTESQLEVSWPYAFL